MPKTETRKAPRSAFEFSSPGAFAIGDRQDDRTPITLLARSPEPIDHWYWGRFVHDLDGMQHAASIPLDYCHDQREAIGVGNRFDVGSEGLTVAGELIHFRQGDRADELATKGKAGVPYQASIYFSDQPDDLRLEYIPEGAFTQANGRQYEGPITIARKSVLRGVAACLYGYDRHTAAKLTARENPDDTVEVTITTEDAMKTKTELSADQTDAPGDDQATAEAATPTDQQPADGEPTGEQSDAGETASDDDAGSGDAEPAGDAPASTGPTELKAEVLRSYVTEFGADKGSEWALAGIPVEEARRMHAETLRSELVASQQETEQLKARLASLSTGEAEPATFSADAKDATTQGGPPAPVSELSNNIGEGLAKLCAANPMPKG